MSSEYHSINCTCRACNRPTGNAQHYTARRTDRRRSRLPVAALGAAIVAILILSTVV